MQLAIVVLLALLVIGAAVLIALYLRNPRTTVELAPPARIIEVPVAAAFDEAEVRSQAELILEEARSKGELLIKEAELQAKDALIEAKNQAEEDLREQRREIAAHEAKLESREETFE